MRRTRILVSAVVLGVSTGACGAATTAAIKPSGPTITIGSPDTTEQVIVANLYAAVLTHAGARVTLQPATGTRSSVEPALASGRLDLYPDEAGALLLFLDPGDSADATRIATTVPTLERALGASGATVLDPAPALETEVFAVTRATAAADHLTTLSSLAPVADKLVLGGPPGCQTQPQCLMGLEHTYGLDFKSFTSLDDAGPVTVAALKGGEVQIAALNASDGSILRNGFVALVDDKHLLDADNLIPVIRTSVDTRRVAGALNRLSAQITTDQLSELTIEVNVDHDAPGPVARRWLAHHHLI
jgi:osmoprotectant transport system substrate-binding protein